MPLKRLLNFLKKKQPARTVRGNPNDTVTRIKMSVGAEPLAELHGIRKRLAANSLTLRERNDLKKREIELSRLLK